jgi:environmental stress-induced protein Ves
MSTAPKLVHPTQVAPERWANGRGWTRALLAWPDSRHWLVRVSVADVETAGPFSAYPGIQRQFAVLEGGGVRLTTAGREPAIVRADDDEMHAFSGDDATDCELLAGATRDLNVMVRRTDVHAVVRALRGVAAEAALSSDAAHRPGTADTVLRTDAALVGCFVCDDAQVATGRAGLVTLPRHTLAWLANPGREMLEWRLAAPAPRGWWIEANRTGNPST